ncbi:uncharacterized protein [Nicotiana sylvestris]|uniref:uncharacterized protein n=1 Tax=Nicotiana sylvestris TaxID=4096 RepID=UPI00388CB47A
MDKQFENFIEVLMQVHVNLPFTKVISQMPAYAMFLKEILSNKELEKEIGAIRSALVSLQLADQIRIIPEEIVKDVLVWEDKFVFPADFIAVNIKENKEVPLILGSSFLATGRAILDIQGKHLMLRVEEERLVFKMKEAIGEPREELVAYSDFKVDVPRKLAEEGCDFELRSQYGSKMNNLEL